MYRITFNTESFPGDSEPPSILVEDYMFLPSGVMKLTYPESTHPRNAQFLAPQVWQNVVIEHVGEEER